MRPSQRARSGAARKPESRGDTRPWGGGGEPKHAARGESERLGATSERGRHVICDLKRTHREKERHDILYIEERAGL